MDFKGIKFDSFKKSRSAFRYR